MSITIPDDGYCEATDVQALNTHRPTYATTTKPTLAQVEGFITNVAAELNAVISGRGYTTPIDDTEALKVLKQYNSCGAAAMAEEAATSVSAGRSEHTDSLWEKYQDGLKLIKTGAVKLGAEATSEGRQTPQGEFNLDADGNEHDPVFERDMDF